MDNSLENQIEIIVSLGSNYGNRTRNVEEAILWMNNVADRCKNSSIYETTEIHGIGKPYMNAVLKGRTAISFDLLQEMMKAYEIEHGRTMERRARGEVPIDIDIVIWDSKVIRPLDFGREFFKIGYSQL